MCWESKRLDFIYLALLLFLLVAAPRHVWCRVHEIGKFQLKRHSSALTVEEFPDYMHFEFQSMDKTFIFWLQRRSGLVGNGSRVVTHRGDDESQSTVESKGINGRPYRGIRLVVLKGKPTDKNGAEVIDDIKNPLARFFAYKK